MLVNILRHSIYGLYIFNMCCIKKGKCTLAVVPRISCTSFAETLLGNYFINYKYHSAVKIQYWFRKIKAGF